MREPFLIFALAGGLLIACGPAAAQYKPVHSYNVCNDTSATVWMAYSVYAMNDGAMFGYSITSGWYEIPSGECKPAYFEDTSPDVYVIDSEDNALVPRNQGAYTGGDGRSLHPICYYYGFNVKQPVYGEVWDGCPASNRGEAMFLEIRGDYYIR